MPAELKVMVITEPGSTSLPSGTLCAIAVLLEEAAPVTLMLTP